MFYSDDNGNLFNIHTELSDTFDKLYDELDKMTPEEFEKGFQAKMKQRRKKSA